MAKSKRNPKGSGAKSRYNKNYHPLLAEAFGRLGYIDEQIAEKLRICRKTLTNWKNAHPEFKKALNSGKSQVDDQVESALLKRALGYEIEEDKIMQYMGDPVIVPTLKHYPPEVIACIFWLKNRRPDKWRDKQEIESNTKMTVVLRAEDENPD